LAATAAAKHYEAVDDEGDVGVSMPTTPTTSRRMAAQRSKDTLIEIRLRSALHGRGHRYRLHERPIPTLRREADVLFRRAKVAIFVDGCFWHGCPEHGTWPRNNAEFWATKISKNIERDRATDQVLGDAGWTVIRVWEHEPVETAVERVERALSVR
jgi:DNA mismatch endonuclease (patch repair protein)